MLWNKFSTATKSKPWMADSESDICLLCHSMWTLRLRRHHCRACHRLVCSNCSDHFVELDADGVAHRVCDECYPKLDIHLDLPCHTSLKGEKALHGTVIESEEALFKVVLHHASGLSPQPVIRPQPAVNMSSASPSSTSKADIPDLLPARHVYCVVSTAEKHSVLKTTKPKLCDPKLEYRAIFEEPMVVKADLSKAFESYLIFQIHDRNGSLVGKCRASLCEAQAPVGRTDASSSAEGGKVVAALVSLSRSGGWECCSCLPTLTYSITRMNPQGYNEGEAIRVLPDLPMYLTEVPHAAAFSVFPSFVRKQRCLPLVHMFPPDSNVHPCLFLSLNPAPPIACSQLQFPSAGLFIPANEFLLEAIGHILHQSSSGVVYLKGVLLCTSHRLIFIQYPITGAPESSCTDTGIGMGNAGVVQCFPMSSIASLQLQKKHKGGTYIALQMTCKDTTGHTFICTDVAANSQEDVIPSKDSNANATSSSASSPLRTVPPTRPIRALDAFRRVEFEVSWRKLEDAFVPSIQSNSSRQRGICLADQFHGFSLEQKRIQQSFSLLDEYIRLGFSLPINSSSKVTTDNQIVSESATNDDINALSLNTSKASSSPGAPSIPLHRPPFSSTPDSHTKNIHSSATPSNPQHYPYHYQSKKWRISEANSLYQLCPSYPPILIVPSVISDAHLAISSKQRSIHRIPALTWIHPNNGAALCRSSQPLVGIRGSLCPEDETHLMCIRGCTFFTPPTHACFTTGYSIASQLKRHGYRVRRDSLSSKTSAHRVRIGASKTTPPPSSPSPPAATTRRQLNVKKKDVMNVLEENFFGNRSSRQSNKKSKNKPTEDRGRDSPAGISSKTKKRSSLTTRKRLSPSLINLQQGTGSDTKSVEKETDAWYDSKSPELTFSTPSSDRDIDVLGDRSTEHTGRLRTSKGTREKSQRQQYYTLSSDRLRQNTAQLHANKTKYIESIHKRNNQTRHVKLRIVDARPYINAKGNALMGKGYEVVERLGGNHCTTLEFANIANIHAVKESYNALRQACSASQASSSIYQTGDRSHHHFSAADSTPTAHANVHIGNTNQSSSTNTEYNKCDNWGTMISDTKWLQHISSVLRGALRCAEYLARGDPVLVHCSDGWDRTAQVCGLAQLLLDPEYRTVNGFRNLISKDFVAFGHMFRTRNGGGILVADAGQESPVFLQFLDACWQVWRQFPSEFQFGQELLQLLVFCCQSRYTMDFLYNSDAEQGLHFKIMLQEYEDSRRRRESTYFSNKEESSSHPTNIPLPSHQELDPDDGPEKCMLSLWSYVSLHLEAFTNPLYKPRGKPPSAVKDERRDLPESDRPLFTNDDTKKETGGGLLGLTAAAMYSGAVVRCVTASSDSDDSDQHPQTQMTNELRSETPPTGTGGVIKIPFDHQQQRSPSTDEDFEFRGRTFGVNTLKELTADELFFEEDSIHCDDGIKEAGSPHLTANNDSIASTLAPANATHLPRTPMRKKVKNFPEEKLHKHKRQQERKKRNSDTTTAPDVATTPPSLPNVEESLKRWVHLLEPNLEVSSLLLWESVYFNQLGLPAGVKLKGHTTVPTAASSPTHTHTHTQTSTASSFTFNTAASSALAYERGLDALCRRQQELLREQERELMNLRQLVVTTRTETNMLESKLALQSVTKFATSDDDDDDGDGDGGDGVAEDEEFVTPASTRSRARAHSDSSILSASQLIVGASHSSFKSTGDDSAQSMHSNYSSASAFSSASSIFHRPFRYHHPTTLLFSPPLASSFSAAASSPSSSVPTAATAASPIITPPRGSASTVLAMNRFHHKQRQMDDTTSFSPLHSPPSGGLSSVSDSCGGSSVSSGNSNQSAHVAIIATATLLEDHYK